MRTRLSRPGLFLRTLPEHLLKKGGKKIFKTSVNQLFEIPAHLANSGYRENAHIHATTISISRKFIVFVSVKLISPPPTHHPPPCSSVTKRPVSPGKQL